MVPADLVLLLPQLKIPAAAPTDLILDDYDEGSLLLSLRLRELDDSSGDDDVVDVVPIVPVVPVVAVIAVISVTLVISVIPVITIATNSHDHSSRIK